MKCAQTPYYSADFRHGRYEWCDKRGKHINEVNIDLKPTGDSLPDHGIRVK